MENIGAYAQVVVNHGNMHGTTLVQAGEREKKNVC